MSNIAKFFSVVACCITLIGAAFTVNYFYREIRDLPALTTAPAPPPIAATETNQIKESIQPQQQPVASVTWEQVQNSRRTGSKTTTVPGSADVQSPKPSDWQRKIGECMDMDLGGIIARSKTTAINTDPPRDMATGRVLDDGRYRPAYFNYGPPFLILHYPDRADRGGKVSCKAVKVGTDTYRGNPIEVWDCKP